MDFAHMAPWEDGAPKRKLLVKRLGGPSSRGEDVGKIGWNHHLPKGEPTSLITHNCYFTQKLLGMKKTLHLSMGEKCQILGVVLSKSIEVNLQISR